MKNRWIITAALCMAMIISASPAFAQEEGAAETPGTEPERVQEIDLPEPDELLMEYMDQTVQLELTSSKASQPMIGAFPLKVMRFSPSHQLKA